MQPASSDFVMSYRDFASALVADGVLSDPWVEGAPRFRMTPVVLTRKLVAELNRAAEAMVALHDEAVAFCAAAPELLARFFTWPASHQRMWLASHGNWHGVARADVFCTESGPVVCELNSDTPSGQAEAVALGRLFACDRLTASLTDPNCELPARISGVVAEAAAAVVAGVIPGRSASEGEPPAVGILYPTELTEDLCVIEQHVRWLEARGCRVVLGSPFNLHADGAGGVALFGVPVKVIYRHYKTDWWGERCSIWRSGERIPDREPIAGPLALLLSAVARGRVAVINPFGAVLPQNKRTMALMWEEIDRFSAPARAAIRRYLPFTARFEALPPTQLKRERAEWVLKSDYGAEGEEVILGAEATQADWSAAVDAAEPRRWVVQRRFRARCDADGNIANFGVYVVAGRAAGLFTRLQRGATDRHALSAATLVSVP